MKRRLQQSAPPPGAPLPSRSPQPGNRLAPLLPLLLILATVIAYQPVWEAGFIWDDDDHVTQNLTLRNAGGLRLIWFEPRALPQYYPMVHTVFWVEYQLWGLHPLGYHVVNVLLHAVAAILLARLLLRMHIRGAWLAAAIFALHPVAVESVAWITELKNVLSASFYFASALAYLRFTTLRDSAAPGLQRWSWYGLALALFAGALFSKTVTCTLPAALLLLRWWERGRLRSSDVMPLLPFFVLGAALGLHTVFLEREHVGAYGSYWDLTFAQRSLIAGRALWFYAGKLLWPANLIFIYPRWNVDPTVWWQWAFPVTAVALILSLWLARARIGRGPVTAVLFFAGTLVPALGFFDVYPMRYSFVADHFQYLASAGLVTLAAAVLAAEWPWPAARRLRPAVVGVLLLALGTLTWRQAAMYADVETLWRTTIARNPTCSMAYNNLGIVLLKAGRTEEALNHFQRAVQLEPENAEAFDSLGTALLQLKQPGAAATHFQHAIALRPASPGSYYNLGTALMQTGRSGEAIAAFESSLRLQPGNVLAHNNLGNVLLHLERLDEALQHFSRALELRPDFAEAANNAGLVLLHKGQVDGAVMHFQRAIALRPGFTEASNNLRYVAWTLATHPEATVRDGTRALALAQQVDQLSGGDDAMALATLAAAYAEVGRYPEAVAAARRALQLAGTQHEMALANELQVQLRVYESGQPYHEPAATPG
jgi:tetratricopeptide (TPR) repeat protein